MVKLVYCLRKRADISSEELYRYWLNDHGPLVRKFAEAIKAKKYVQSHTVAPEVNEVFRASRGLAQPYDGITEVWWDDPTEGGHGIRRGTRGAPSAEGR